MRQKVVKTLDFDNDLRIDERGRLAIADGLEGLRQKVKQRLLTSQGEYILDITIGVPYREDILTIPVLVNFATAIISNEIFKEGEVTEVNVSSAEINNAERIFQYTATITSNAEITEVTI